ncbi:MAG: serine/threonine-protein phosphatase [Planctomycetaceae bacterium]|nr:serine/threonine-protein phosphatase [Planctomycetaceae bacterium]
MTQHQTNVVESHVLQCMEIWSGTESTKKVVSAPGLDAWIYSQPYLGQSSGGDVHYFSLCVGGIVTRMVLADVAGHGDYVASTSENLRRLLRRFMNFKKQNRLVAELNQEFMRNESEGRFATAIVATFLSHTRKILLTNAGHPRPLFYNSAEETWSFLDDSTMKTNSAGSNFPLGFVADSKYQHVEFNVRPNDWLILYTDALTEASIQNHENELLGEHGLCKIVQGLPASMTPAEFGQALLTEIESRCGGLNADDTTIMAYKFSDHFRQPGILEKLKGYSKLITGS